MEEKTYQDNSEFHDLSKANLNKICSVISKVGYSDGITDGREAVFQIGFDKGYEQGVRTGFEIAKLKTLSKIILEQKKSVDENIIKECEMISEFKLSKPTSQDHFKFLNHSQSSLEVISNAQTNYVDELNNKIKSECPSISNLW